MTANPRALPDAIGPYEVIGPLGRGGTATVFRALDQRTGAEVALKLLVPRKLVAEAEERFRREFRAMSALSHPAIVRVFESGVWGEYLWYTMELLRGSTLEAYRKAQPDQVLPIRKALELMEQVAEGLGAAHAAGLVHRDVKPRNLIVGETGDTLSLVDFGLAKLAGAGKSLTADGKVVGTPVWLAPERLSSQVIANPTADVYSLGLVFYEAITGVNPFRGATIPQTLNRIARGRIPAASAYRPDLPLVVDRLLLGSVSRTPEKRPADGTVLASRIRATLQEIE